MTHKEKAMKIFYEKFNCSQAVLGAYADDYGLTVDQAMKVAACFPTIKQRLTPRLLSLWKDSKKRMLHISARIYLAVTYPPKRGCSMPGRMDFLRIFVREW